LICCLRVYFPGHFCVFSGGSAIKLFSRSKSKPPQQHAAFDPDTPLVHLSTAKQDAWTIRDSFEGAAIFGATGSGKTSGSGQALARAFLAAGYGGLILTHKTDERQLWERYCKEAGRSDDLMVVSPDQPYRFNFLRYESKRPDRGGGLTENLVNLFYNLMEAADAGGSRHRDPFWDRAVKQLLRNAIDLLQFADQELSMPAIIRLVNAAPQSQEQAFDAQWQSRSFMYQCLELASQRDAALNHADLEVVTEFWMHEWPGYDPRTRSNVQYTFTTLADGFNRGILRELFSTKLNIVPEYSLAGKLILMDLPIKTYRDLGRFSQVLFKYVWQQAVERRDLIKQPRPVFLWVDEASNFLTSHDKDFQSTARSSGAATVYLAQNITGYYAALDGGQSHAQTEAFLGNLQTKIFHANGDPATNEWAERIFAKDWHAHVSASSSSSPDKDAHKDLWNTNTSSHSTNVNRSFDSEVPAHRFTTLRKGGPGNGLAVDAILFQAGRRWALSGHTSIQTTFRQQ